MKSIKNDPYELLKKEGVAKNLLSEEAKDALLEYDELLEELKEFPTDKNLLNTAEKVGRITIEVLEEEIATMRREQEQKEESSHKKKQKELQSKEIMEKTEKTIDYLSECRAKLRAERKHKIETGEIKAQVKKKLTTRLKEILQRIPGLMPPGLKTDKQKIEATEKALRKFLFELKKIWGMNKIKMIEEGIEEKIDKLKQAAEKKEEKGGTDFRLN